MPQTIVQGKTRLGQDYEVNFENGVKVLNSQNANYSFGSLHQIMLKGIFEVLKKISPKNVLMLGLGAGSALSILANKCSQPYKVTVVEIDQDLIDIAGQHFGLHQYQNIQIIQGDVVEKIKELPAQAFDFIIDDIFWDNQMPAFCLSQDYLQDACGLLTEGGVYMRNTMNLQPEEEEAFENKLRGIFANFYHLKHNEHNNKIYFCSR